MILDNNFQTKEENNTNNVLAFKKKWISLNRVHHLLSTHTTPHMAHIKYLTTYKDFYYRELFYLTQNRYWQIPGNKNKNKTWNNILFFQAYLSR